MTATRLIVPSTAFAQSHGRKRARQFREDHLAFVRQLPCLICGRQAPSEAAHIRYGSKPHGKRETGMSEKPSDQWTVPLCDRDHRTGPDAQHNSNERDWWLNKGVDPLIIAALLYASSGDVDAGEQIIRSWK